MLDFFSTPVDIKISLFAPPSAPKRKGISLPRHKHSVPLYYRGESVEGTLVFDSKKTVDYESIKIELIGQVRSNYDRGSTKTFLHETQILTGTPGELISSVPRTYNFLFPPIFSSNESYTGVNIHVNYFVKVTILRGFMSPDIVCKEDLWFLVPSKPPIFNDSIKLEVGIEDLLHIEFEYNKRAYHLKEVIIGKIFFLLVQRPIKFMEISLVSREFAGLGPNMYHESSVITRFEIMDSTPIRGESIPVRFFLSAFELLPTYTNVEGRFSLKYFLNLVLVDFEDKQYYKQQEIFFYRKAKADYIFPENTPEFSLTHQANPYQQETGINTNNNNNNQDNKKEDFKENEKSEIPSGEEEEGRSKVQTEDNKERDP